MSHPLPRAASAAAASAATGPRSRSCLTRDAGPGLFTMAAGVTMLAMVAQVALVALMAVAPVTARAADAQALYVKALAATCANCHGTHGKAQKDASVPGLAGMPAEALVEQMQAFRNGTRPATIMHQIAKGYNDEQVRQLADYFARQK